MADAEPWVTSAALRLRKHVTAQDVRLCKLSMACKGSVIGQFLNAGDTHRLRVGRLLIQLPTHHAHDGYICCAPRIMGIERAVTLTMTKHYLRENLSLGNSKLEPITNNSVSLHISTYNIPDFLAKGTKPSWLKTSIARE